MLDLGTSFLGSVARDPNALAIVDGSVRFTYAEWYRRISALVGAFDALNLRPGDHLVTVLQNNWQAATIHWACQFAGLILTDRKSTRLNSSHGYISYAVFCLKKKKKA